MSQAEDSIIYRKQALVAGEEEFRRTPGTAGLARLIGWRRDLAWLLHGRGHLDEAKSLMEKNWRTLESPPAGCDGRPLVIQRLLCRIDPSRVAEGSATAWAAMVAQALHSTDPDPAVAARHEAEDALEMSDHLVVCASTLRRSGNVEGAEGIAEKMLALARHFIEAHHDQPASHLALSFAYSQMYKNAYAKKDQPGIRTNMRLARDAAREALRLDRDSARARNAVDDLQRRLADLTPGG